MMHPLPANDFLYDLVIVGGGAAGIFAALAAKEQHPTCSVIVVEKTAVPLSKVKVSGGGRCNVTHACFDPALLATHYPRGHKELIGPFHRFQPRDTIAWFAKRGVSLKTEADGRLFPSTDSSSTIIDCFLLALADLGIPLYLRQRVEQIKKDSSSFILSLAEDLTIRSHKLLLATGSQREGYAWAEDLGHTVHPPIPSLFTFHIPQFRFSPLSGTSIDPVEATVGSYSQKGPLLLTHFGCSGPAILKLSAWAAKVLHAANYHHDLSINWLPDLSLDKIEKRLLLCKQEHPQKTLGALQPFSFTKQFWKTYVEECAHQKCGMIADKRLRALADSLHHDVYTISGKTTHKEEFVTCGGIPLHEVDCKKMESKVCPGLYFAGEILDIDGVTGGFNFQNAWTTGYIAGTSAC